MIDVPAGGGPPGAGRSQPDELGVLVGRDEVQVERLVGLRVARPVAHVGEPVADVREAGIVALRDLPERQHPHAEVVGDGDRIAAEVAVVADDVAVEDRQPVAGLARAPLERRALHRRVLAPVVR